MGLSHKHQWHFNHDRHAENVNVTQRHSEQITLAKLLHSFKANLHATSLRHAYDTKKSHRILKHVLKPYEDRGLKSVVSVL